MQAGASSSSSSSIQGPEEDAGPDTAFASKKFFLVLSLSLKKLTSGGGCQFF